MGFFRPSQWLIDALVTISAQLKSIERKVNMLLQLSEDQGKLSKLASQLDTSTDSLESAVEKNQPTNKKG